VPPKRKPGRRGARSRLRTQPIPEVPLEQGLVEMATIGAQSVLWLVLVIAALAAVATAAVIAWSQRPVPIYLSERVKTGSPFDVEFWVENASPWFAMSRPSISCVLSYPGAPDLPPTPASDLQLPAGDTTALKPGEMAIFKCPFPAALRTADEIGAATRAEIYFRIEYDAPLVGRLSDTRGPFVLNTRVLPPRWMGRTDR
jgi:hypothetical protein